MRTTSRIPTESYSIGRDGSPSYSQKPAVLSKEEDRNKRIVSPKSPSERSFSSVESIEESCGILEDSLEESKASRLSNQLKKTALLVGGSLDGSDRLSDGSERFDFNDHFAASEQSMKFDRLVMSERTMASSNPYSMSDRLAQSERSFRSGTSGRSGGGNEKLLDNSDRLTFLMSSTHLGEDMSSSSDESDMDEHHLLYEE